MLLCDLHCHSVFSDGTCTPQEILKIAEEKGLAAVALTDHNTVAGLQPFSEASLNYKVEAIFGIEISSDYNGKELHILALFIPPRYFDKFKDFLSVAVERKEESNILLAEKLNAAGYKVNYEEIKAKTAGKVNRVHFAKALVESGYVNSVKEAMDGILAAGAGFYVPPKRHSAFEVIKFIKSLNCAAVLAHPLLNLTESELEIFLKKAKDCGLDAIETEYSTYGVAERETSERLAEKFGLKRSGGSDFHGGNKPNISLGEGTGNLKVPYDFALALKQGLK